ncbi:hypothetical protein Vadar_007298 [Vaccinium darrowii]|uniref:Uncharacterized protein n=1 Tax=Vaccinium darrowii TaxID=229202 RepID=A0ACB7Y6X2_9ERIC|nr:hypothetical protein Vadar_007298 [Vaccinium darrowii]
MEDENRFRLVNPETVPMADHQALRKDFEDLQAVVQQLLNRGQPNVGPSTPQHPSGLEASSTQHPPQFNFGSPLNTPSFQSRPPVNIPGFSPQPPPNTPNFQYQQLPVIPTTSINPNPLDNVEIPHEDPNPPPGVDFAVTQKLQQLEDSLRAMQGPNAYASTNFSDLCFFPNQPLPPKFKIPDFTKFNGTTDPMTHLRLYAGALSGYPNPDKLMMQLFQHSLTGPAAQWFARLDVRRFRTWTELSQEFIMQYRHNAEIVMDRLFLMRMSQEHGESFRAYALRWKNVASQVEPALLDHEYVHYFVQTLKDSYFERLCTSIGRSFHEVIQQGEMIEDGIRTGKIIDMYAKIGEAPSSSHSKRTPSKKAKESDVALILPVDNSLNRNTRPQNPYPQNYQQPYQQPFQPQYQPQYQLPQYMPSAPLNQPATYSPNQPARNPPRRRNFTPIAIPWTEVFNRLVASGHISPMPARPPPNILPPTYKPDAKCAFHSGQPGHDTESCWTLRNKVQDLIDAKIIELEESTKPTTPNVTNNPLPNHQGINVILDEEDDFSPLQLIGALGTIVVQHRRSETPIIAMIGRNPRGRGRAGYMQNPRLGNYNYHQQIAPFTCCPSGSTTNLPSAPLTTLPIRPKVKLPSITQLPVSNLCQVPWTYAPTPVTTEAAVDEIGGMTRSGRVYTPAELESRRKGKEKEKPVLTEEEITEFVKVLKMSEYDVVEQLKKTPAHINILALLLSSEPHREALLSIIKEAQVPKDISPENFQNMVSSIMAPGVVTFSDDEIPDKGIGHTKALHIAVKTKGMIVARVLVDNGSALNICPYSTLQRLGMDKSCLHHSSIIVRAFDGSQRQTIGEVELPVEIGSITFSIKFQVLEIPSAYNFLLGRPWIHVTGGVPSTLHQKIKFIIAGQLITVYAEEEFAIYKAPAIPFLESAEPSSYQTLEYVTAIQGTPVTPQVSDNSKAIACCFRHNNFCPGKGLGVSLQGETSLRDIPTQIHTFGLGYKPTSAERRAAVNKRRGVTNHPEWQKLQRLPPLRRSFVSGGFERSQDDVVQVPSVQEEDIHVSVESLADLFQETLVIDVPGLGSDNSDPQAAGIHPAYPGEKLQNWTSQKIVRARKFWDPKIRPFDPNDVTILAHDEYDFDVELDFELMGFEIDTCDEVPEEIKLMADKHDDRKTPNIEETETINLGTVESPREVKIGTNLDKWQKKEFEELLKAYKDVFAWSYEDMPEGNVVTNNIAEYEACILGLRMALQYEILELTVWGDSDLIIQQSNETFKTRDPKLAPYHQKVKELRKRFNNIKFIHIPRTDNSFADALATLAAAIQFDEGEEIPAIQIELRHSPAYCSAVAEELDGHPWHKNAETGKKNASAGT